MANHQQQKVQDNIQSNLTKPLLAVARVAVIAAEGRSIESLRVPLQRPLESLVIDSTKPRWNQLLIQSAVAWSQWFEEAWIVTVLSTIYL